MSFERDSVQATSPLLTIVVAAYNVEGYIEEALESLLSQPHIDRLKIIVVDDGSPDETHAAVQAMIERDGGAHIQLIRQQNSGVSAARNTGLASVSTPYVGFLDGDDIYLKGFTEAVIPRLAEGNYDMIEYNVSIIDDEDRELEQLELVTKTEGGDHAVDRSARLDFADKFHTFVWARVYRTEFFKTMQFPVGRVYEDMALIPSIFLRAKRFYRIAEPLIGYRRRFGSITQKSTLHDMRDLQVNGVEALARCDGGEMDDFWLAVFDKIFHRACHVCARVDRASFREASEILSRMAADHRDTRARLGERNGRQVVELKPFDLDVRKDRSIHFLKSLVKKVLRRSLDHHQRARRPLAQERLRMSERSGA
ncbi:Glycosyl transferase family 2 [Burkholderia sp. 8Y]|uniref:glycosyltransferase family 2 protein n=1 Tax=Burkholderia sp. 8Y TaxID=2653133 RepID=UPI0012F28CD6|nr:glycosyltransferase family 2 protein [Burkholderia sp. 8Y]VXB06354.1 Glycosyl transferase family 2 [Burkholderia sp. 8Y]